MISNRPTAHRVRQWSAGVGLAGGAAVTAGMIALAIAPSAQADDPSPADLLADAQTEFVDANQVLNEIPSNDIPSLVLNQFQDQDTALVSLSTLGLAETSISSYDNGALSDVVSPYFTNLDQNWYQAGEAVLNADTALDAAIVSGAGLNAAELGAIVPDLQVISDVFSSGAIEQAAGLLASF
jgi:hypothetical protein